VDQSTKPQTSCFTISETTFDPAQLHHKETIFTIGNGYLSTRGSFEEGYPGDHAATFAHGVFDAVPIVFTELANLPNWAELNIYLDGERFSLTQGEILYFNRTLDLFTGVLKRQVRWQSPQGHTYDVCFERFTNLADPHVLCLRVSVTPLDIGGKAYAIVEFRAGLNGGVDNLGILHWNWLDQKTEDQAAWLQLTTRASGIELGMAMQLTIDKNPPLPPFSKGGVQTTNNTGWDVQNHPTLVARLDSAVGETVVAEKIVTVFTSRDLPDPAQAAWDLLRAEQSYDDKGGVTPPLQDQNNVFPINSVWNTKYAANQAAWKHEWDLCDLVIEGDNDAQLAVRFNLFQLLIAAPRHDEKVNIGAKTLSGFGYRGHAFWDTEIFMLPFFTFTRPEIARNLLSYRWHTLPGARRKAQGNGYSGAQYAWESAATGDEVTPTWVPHFSDPTKLVRIWTGDIEIHVSADIIYGILQYWRTTGDDAFMLERGLEIILETARFWASRAEWNSEKNRYEFNDVIGPDEYHDHVDNNAYTNYMARWHLLKAIECLAWAEAAISPAALAQGKELITRLNITPDERTNWQNVADKIYIPYDPDTHLIEQFQGYFQRRDVEIKDYAHLKLSMQVILGIEGATETQVLKQPDVVILQYLLPELFDEQTIQANYAYYTPRTDHVYGSSLGPAIQAIIACRVGRPEEGYEHFLRAAHADLYDVRGNAGDGIHGASAGGLWQAVVFGFAGLRITPTGWTTQACLPAHWQRVAFKFFDHGKLQEINLVKDK